MTKNKFLLPLNIQFFADPPAVDPADPKDPPADPVDPPADPVDPPSEEEINRRIEAEADRKLAKALDKKQKEWQAQQDKAIQDALAEKERLSKLSEKERKDEELSKREQQLADRLADIERKELKADAVTDLTNKQLPASFADFLLSDSAESTLENINAFKTAFDEAVNAAVKEKLRQDTPPAGGGASRGAVPSIAKMAEESRLIK